jgi:hypothetical protein
MADVKTKLISDVRFTDPSDKSVMDISQRYTGGTTYPFLLTVNNSPDSNGSFGVTIDSKTNKYKFNFAALPGTKSDDKTTVTADFTLQPGNEALKVTAPKKSTPIMQVLNKLGLSDGSFPAANSKTAASDDDKKLFVIEAQNGIEAYKADNLGKYPVSQQVFNSWVTSPHGTESINASGDPGNKKFAVKFTPANGYTYTASPKGCNNKTAACTDYTITARLSDGETLKKTSAF